MLYIAGEGIEEIILVHWFILVKKELYFIKIIGFC